MISYGIAGNLLLDVVSVPDVSGAVPFFALMIFGCAAALIVGACLLLYFLVFKNRKKK